MKTTILTLAALAFATFLNPGVAIVFIAITAITLNVRS